MPSVAVRRILTIALALAGLACVVAGVAWIFPPLGLVVLGLLILAAVTFDPDGIGRLTWPR